jgi:acyl carrier protein
MEGNRLSDKITQTVIASIAKAKKLSPETISLDSTFEELKMDSLDGLDLFFELEEAFDLTIPDDRARSLRTVRNIVEEIENMLLAQKKSCPVQR